MYKRLLREAVTNVSTTIYAFFLEALHSMNTFVILQEFEHVGVLYKFFLSLTRAMYICRSVI